MSLPIPLPWKWTDTLLIQCSWRLQIKPLCQWVTSLLCSLPPPPYLGKLQFCHWHQEYHWTILVDLKLQVKSHVHKSLKSNWNCLDHVPGRLLEYKQPRCMLVNENGKNFDHTVAMPFSQIRGPFFGYLITTVRSIMHKKLHWVLS